MSTALFGWPIWSDASLLYTPSSSTGSWDSDLPAANVFDRRLGLIARSTNDDAASTKMEIDLGRECSIRVVAVLLPNISKSSATVRFRGSNSAGSFGSPLFDSTAFNPWVSGLDADEAESLYVWSFYVLPQAVTARYVLMEIVDTSNADGYVDVARLCICGGYQPAAANLNYGAKHGYESETVRTVSPGGAAIYDVYRRRRNLQFSISHVSESESFGTVTQMIRRVGTHGQFFWVFDPADSTYAHERNFLAVMRECSSLEYAYTSRQSVAFNIVEEL